MNYIIVQKENITYMSQILYVGQSAQENVTFYIDF